MADLLSSEPSRLRPLFSVGVHDIPFLEEEAKKIKTPAPLPQERDRLGGEQGSWVACTTDEVLYLKRELYDVVVTMPPHYNKGAKNKVWPTIECPAGTPVKATQRDLSRYRALKRSLKRYKRRRRDNAIGRENGAETGADDGEDSASEHAEASREEQVCEKLSWREIAYTSFMWWASAGEKRRETEAERNYDEMFFENGKRRSGLFQEPDDDEVVPLLPTSPRRASSSPLPRTVHHRRRSSGFSVRSYSDMGSMEMDIVAYFHRLTGKLMTYMAEIVDDSSDEDGSDEDEGGVFVTLDDMDKLGLDRYSDADIAFVENICTRYFGREATVESNGWTCCGVKCC